jgi:hypothetical protein
MSQAVGHDRAQLPYGVGSRGIAQLNGLGESGHALFEHVCQVFSGMLHARDEQSHAVRAELRDQADRVDPLAQLLASQAQVGAVQDLHDRVVLLGRFELSGIAATDPAGNSAPPIATAMWTRPIAQVVQALLLGLQEQEQENR